MMIYKDEVFILFAGFVFMLIVDQMSSRYNDASNPTEKNITATVGLVVHAAGNYCFYY